MEQGQPTPLEDFLFDLCSYLVLTNAAAPERRRILQPVPPLRPGMALRAGPMEA